jgi:catechol 2,3-dioxygenase-like lactoylglutathione lyase family enzyme
MRLEHVNLTVTDLDRSVAFYCDLLDFHVRWKGAVDVDRMGAHVGTDDFYLALFQATQPGDVPRNYLAPGVNHVGFVVDDLEAARARLSELCGTEHLEADYEPGRRIYFFDPDGYEVELVEY